MYPYCNLQLEYYSLDSLNIQANDAFEPGKYAEFNDHLECDFDFFKKEDEERFMMPVSIAVNAGSELTEMIPYSLEIKLTAFFKHDPDINPEAVKFSPPDIVQNCFMAAYSLARVILDDVTAKSRNGRYLLPLVDVATIMKEKNRRQEEAAAGEN